MQLVGVYEQKLTSEAFAEWGQIFRRTLHEKTLYSIAADKWVPYKINAEECRDIDRATEMLILRLNTPAQ